MYPLGGVFWRRGTPKSVEQGANYSEGYMRYPNGFKGFVAYNILYFSVKIKLLGSGNLYVIKITNFQ